MSRPTIPTSFSGVDLSPERTAENPPQPTTVTTRNGAADLAICWTERVTHEEPSTTECALRLLARLLVRTAASARTAPAAEPQIPLDVAAPSKVGSDRD